MSHEAATPAEPPPGVAASAEAEGGRATPPGWYPTSDGRQRYWDGAQWDGPYLPQTGPALAAPTPTVAHRQPQAYPHTGAFPVQNGYCRPSAYVMTDRQTDNNAAIAISWVIAVLSGAYMLPWAIAETRGKSNSVSICLINFFTGWTGIGWVIALIMACTAHQRVYLRY